MSGRAWDNMRKGILFGLCLIIATLFIAYGIIIKAAGSGTGFYIIWFVIAAVLAGLGVIIHWQLWSRIPFGIRIIAIVLCGILLLSFVIIESCVVSHMHDKGEDGLDYIVVLGAQMRQNGPSIVLQYRLDEAIKYLNDNPDTICIVSGGQGYNEPCTEAQGMAEYLEKKGVPKVRILMETESTTTAQNISNSMQYIREGATVGIVTNNFHMFRALQIAKKQGLTQVCGIAAKSKALYLPNNMLREYLAEIKYLFPTKPIRVILQTESKDIHSK